LKQEIEFTKAVYSGLAHEVMSDPELLVLTTAGIGLASRSRLLKGIGIAMTGWYLSRKVDYYYGAAINVFDSKTTLIASVINAGNPKEANERTSTRSESGTPPR
jgi:hypothetical protein